MKIFFSFVFLVALSSLSIAQTQYPVVSIATARGMVSDTVSISGVTISPNYQTSNRSYYIWDGTGGIDVFRSGLTSPALKLGDSVVVTGSIALYNGLIEIQPLADSSIVVKDSNKTVPKPELVSIHDFNTYGESYESHLVTFSHLTKLSGTWPTSASNKTILLTDGKDTLTMYVDSDTKLYNNPEPIYPVDVVGVGSQFAASGVGGYQLLPRYTTDFITTDTLPSAGSLISIDSSRKALNDTVKISGVVISPNYQTVNRSYYIWDGTSGIDLFSYTLTQLPALNLGDSVVVVGVPTIYNGLIEINPLIDTTFASFIVKKSGSAVPQPQIISVHEFNTNAEKYESHLIGFIGLNKASGTWSTSGSSTLKLTDGLDTLTAYLDSDMKLYTMTQPTWPVDVVGIGSQYTTTGSGGYQLLPRYTTDFLPNNSLPVELSTFTAKVSQKSVVLTWQTATETNNAGFDVERSSGNTNFQKIAFVKGNGNSTGKNSYSFADQNLEAGSYSYRLKQIDYSGKFEYSKVVEAEVLSAPTTFSLSQNYPNPFNPSTVIKFSVEKTGLTTLIIYNMLGQEVSTLFNGIAANGQVYALNFNASALSSGVYFYQLKQGDQIKIQKMMLLK